MSIGIIRLEIIKFVNKGEKMQIKIVVSTVALIAIMGCGGGSGGETSSFDSSDNAPKFQESNATSETETLDSSKHFKISGNKNEKIFTVTATDNSDITYYLTGRDSIHFYIDPIVGKVFFRGKEEYDNTSSFFITVVVKDAVGNVSHKDYIIDLIAESGQVNDNAPVIHALEQYNLVDDIYDNNSFEIEAEDRNPISFSLKDKSFKFTLHQNGNRATIRLLETPIEKDFVSTIKVLATNIYGNQSSREIRLNVEKVTTEQPSIIFLSKNEFSIEENSLTKCLIKTNLKPFSIEYDPFRYQLFGEDAKYFNISYELEDSTDHYSNVKATSIVLKAPADYEFKKEYNLILVANEEEQGTASQHITMKILDRDEKKKDIEKPIFRSKKEQIYYGEFHADCKFLGRARASDDNAIQYSLKGGDSNHLVINPKTGEVYVAEHMFGNTKEKFEFTVVATDAQGNNAMQDMVVDRVDIFVSPYRDPVYHNIETDGHIEVLSGSSKTITTLQTTKHSDSFTLRGEDKDDFILDEETGLLEFRDVPNYFIKSFYKININGKIIFITVKKP